MRLAIVIAVALTVSGCQLERKPKETYEYSCATVVDHRSLAWKSEEQCKPGAPVVIVSEVMYDLLWSSAVLCDQSKQITLSEMKVWKGFTLVCTLSDDAFESYWDVFKRLNDDRKRKAEIKRLIKKYE